MPTAATADEDSDSNLISKQGTAALSTLAQPVRGPTHGGHLKFREQHMPFDTDRSEPVSKDNPPYDPDDVPF
jgi:hypothetical protein